MGNQPPLAGITVLDLSELLPGPYATQHLVELGARVIKVERPGGDGARKMFPGLFQAINRGKESITLDLKSEADRTVLKKLVKTADVVIESNRPGVTTRLGVDYATLSEINPRLIYCSISGYGQTGPSRNWPGHDMNYAAMAGAVAISGRPDGPPEHTTGVPIGDIAAASFALISILSALRARDVTGKGQYLDVSITDALTSWIMPRYGVWDLAQRQGTESGKAEILQRPGYGVFATADGQHLTLGAIETHFFRALLRVTGLTQFDDAVYDDYLTRKKATDKISDALAACIIQKDYAFWAEAFEREDVPFSRVNSLAELADDPQLAARGMIRQAGEANVIAYPVPMDGIDGVAANVPTPGEHGKDILAEIDREEP
ncbi:CaiB/BaiF CoA transferase family protein [Profundibacter sp.]